MACNVTLNGIVKDCAPSMGGIKAAYIANFNEVTTVVTDNMISAITAEEGTFKAFRFRKNTGSFTTTINKDESTGTTYYSTEILLQFLRQETEKRLEIAALAIGDIVVIIQDNNNNFWYFGYDEPVILSAGTAETGTGKADFNGYNITLVDESSVLPYQVVASLIDKLMEESE